MNSRPRQWNLRSALRLHRGTLAAAVALTAMACVTINVYFPEAAVKDLSQRIEEAVAREAAAQRGEEPGAGSGEPPAETPTTGSGDNDPSGGDLLARAAGTAIAALLRLTAPTVAADTVAAPEVTNPAIRRIIDSRAARLPALTRFKRQGVVGENNRALVEIRDLSSLALQQRAEVQRLVKAENEDRRRMFREIAAATKADLSQLSRIQETYAATLRRNARSGDWIQQPNGRWTRK